MGRMKSTFNSGRLRENEGVIERGGNGERKEDEKEDGK